MWPRLLLTNEIAHRLSIGTSLDDFQMSDLERSYNTPLSHYFTSHVAFSEPYVQSSPVQYSVKAVRRVYSSRVQWGGFVEEVRFQRRVKE